MEMIITFALAIAAFVLVAVVMWGIREYQERHFVVYRDRKDREQDDIYWHTNAFIGGAMPTVHRDGKSPYSYLFFWGAIIAVVAIGFMVWRQSDASWKLIPPPAESAESSLSVRGT